METSYNIAWSSDGPTPHRPCFSSKSGQRIHFPSNPPDPAENKVYWKLCKIDINGDYRVDRNITVLESDMFGDGVEFDFLQKAKMIW